MGVIDGSTETGRIFKIGEFRSTDFTSPPMVAADPDRRSLTKKEWREEYFTTSTHPVGHSFNLVPSSMKNDGATSFNGCGFLDDARWTWFKNKLDAGDVAGRLMIIAMYVPIGVCSHADVFIPPKDTCMDWFDNSANLGNMQNAIDLAGLIAELHDHPNLLMWIAGHRHVNTVKALIADDV